MPPFSCLTTLTPLVGTLPMLVVDNLCTGCQSSTCTQFHFCGSQKTMEDLNAPLCVWTLLCFMTIYWYRVYICSFKKL